MNYYTQTYADEGKVWIEALVGDVMTFMGREISDPEGMMKAGGDAHPIALEDGDEMPLLEPEALGALIEAQLHEIYKNWEDQIPFDLR